MAIPLTTELAEGLEDAAKRLKERHDLALLSLPKDEIMCMTGRWIAARIDDGTSGPTIYETRGDAVRAVSDERYYVFVRIQPTGMRLDEAATVIAFARAAYKAGYRMPNPDTEPIMPTGVESLFETTAGNTIRTSDLMPTVLPDDFLEVLRNDPGTRHIFRP